MHVCVYKLTSVCVVHSSSMRCENGRCLIDSEGGEITPGSPEDEMEGRAYAATLILCSKASLAEAEKPADTQVSLAVMTKIQFRWNFSMEISGYEG